MSLNLNSSHNNPMNNTYSLEFIQNIIYSGFNYVIPEDAMEKINNLSREVGSPGYIKTPVFHKKEQQHNGERKMEDNDNQGFKEKERNRKKRNKFNEITDDSEWNNVNQFQTTKIEAKTGIHMEIDIIRTLINKMTDKNFDDTKNKIIEIMERLMSDYSKVYVCLVSKHIFDIVTSNKYHSKNFASLYSILIEKYDFIRDDFRTNFNMFTQLFDNIEYVDPNEDYNMFCEINKINEKRKILSLFYNNLMIVKTITKNDIIQIIKYLLTKIYTFISIENKKNEVDELTENLIILYNKEDSNDSDNDIDNDIDNDSDNDSDSEPNYHNQYIMDGLTIHKTIEKILELENNNLDAINLKKNNIINIQKELKREKELFKRLF